MCSFSETEFTLLKWGPYYYLLPCSRATIADVPPLFGGVRFPDCFVFGNNSQEVRDLPRLPPTLNPSPQPTARALSRHAWPGL